MEQIKKLRLCDFSFVEMTSMRVELYCDKTYEFAIRARALSSQTCHTDEGMISLEAQNELKKVEVALLLKILLED